MKNRAIEIDGETIALVIQYKGNEIFCYIDKQDLDIVSSIKGTWNLAVNRSGHIDGVKTKVQKLLERKQVWLHNVVFKKTNPSNVVDHIDHNTLNNRKCNLREVTRKENAQNISTALASKTKHRNVTIEGKRYRVRINGVSFKSYDTLEKAISVADRERAKMFPKSNLLNQKIQL